MSRASRLAPVLAVAALWLGCSSLETDAHQFGATLSEKLLKDAGFHIVAADTPEKINALNGLPPGKISRVDRGGQIYYVFPDRFKCQCLWVGNDEQNARFERLVADETMPAVELAGPAAEVDSLSGGPDPWGNDPW